MEVAVYDLTRIRFGGYFDPYKNMKPRSSTLSDVWRIANSIAAEIDTWLSENDNRQLKLRYNRVDQIRLLKLRVWSFRHRLEIHDVLDLIVPPLRTVMSRQKNSYGLGISVRTLTSKNAYKILLSRLKQAYPDDEHLGIWRERERERQLEAEALIETDGLVSRGPQVFNSVLDSQTAEEFISRYKKRVISARESYQMRCDESWRKRRHYRSNPWL